MKKLFPLLLLGLTLNVFAVTKEEAETVSEEDCQEVIKDLNCGLPGDARAFITCVDLRSDELSDRCETYLLNVVEKIKNGY